MARQDNNKPVGIADILVLIGLLIMAVMALLYAPFKERFGVLLT